MGIRTAVTVTLVCLLGLAACGQPSPGTVPLPPRDASASVVLGSYLRALVTGDCATAHHLAGPTFVPGNGELCGVVKVKAFAVNKVPASPGPNEVEYGTYITTTGSHDHTIPSGRTTWFYELQRQDGQWRLVGGGSGP